MLLEQRETVVDRLSVLQTRFLLVSTFSLRIPMLCGL